jgi:murein DD-endopeptidase MepM/ murein hydrolase activator NlpD
VGGPPRRAAPVAEADVSGFKLIGFPFEGTHTLGNWQSDRAVDAAVPTGTPVYAAGDGTITRAGLLPGGGTSGAGQFDGYRVQLEGAANSFWYGHLSKLNVKVGDSVQAGDLLGYSGSANGVQHLHFAALKGAVSSLVSRALKGDASSGSSSDASTTPSSSSDSSSFLSDPAGALVSGLLKPIEQNALRMLLYGVLVIGAVGLIVSGSLRITHEEVA